MDLPADRKALLFSAGGVRLALRLSHLREIVPAPAEGGEIVARGDRLYHGEEGGASCAGCHGSDGAGTPLGPALTAHDWLWSDGSYRGIQNTIHDGVANPKQFRSAMPAMGGAALTADQLSALAAYVWAISHRPVTR